MLEKEHEGPVLEARCDGCGRWIDSPAVRVGEGTYCCDGCAEGRGCDCPDLTRGEDPRRVLQPEWTSLSRG